MQKKIKDKVKRLSSPPPAKKTSIKKKPKIDGFLAYQMFKAQNQFGAEYEGKINLQD